MFPSDEETNVSFVMTCCVVTELAAVFQYEVKAPMPSLCFRNVCKQMAKMHEAIYELLPEEQTQVSDDCVGVGACA